MIQSNEQHWEGTTNPRVAARILEVLAGLVGCLGLLTGLLLLADEEPAEGLVIIAAAVGVTALLYCGAVAFRWLAAVYELAASRLQLNNSQPQE